MKAYRPPGLKSLYSKDSRSAFSQVPDGATLSLGGFTCVHPEAWRQYLNAEIRKKHPRYFIQHILKGGDDQSWMGNDCILQSLRQYLFAEFGLLLPQDSLFKVYNPGGKGILPGQILSAISAVIEPFGFEIDKVLAPDAELRQGLGNPDKALDLSHVDEFDGLPGIGMIQIENGRSHAFFWTCMEKEKFTDERFRMALLVCRKDGKAIQPRSALAGLQAYCLLVEESLGCNDEYPPGYSDSKLIDVLSATRSLTHLTLERISTHKEGFRQEIDQLLTSLQEYFSVQAKLHNRGQAASQATALVEGAGMLRKIIKEAQEIS